MLTRATAVVEMWSGRPLPRNASREVTPSRNFYGHFLLLLTFLALLPSLTPLAAAQRAAHGGFVFGRTAHPSGFRRSTPYTSLPFPFLGDFLSLDDLYSSGYPVASQPPAVLLRAAHAMSNSPDYPDHPETIQPSPAQPLMIELQNGRYVRVSSAAADGEALPLTFASESQPTTLVRHGSRPVLSSGVAQSPTTAPAPANLAPAVLVFHDGHTEEVRDYTIADGILYARGDFYSDGYWNKKIELSTLDVNQTLHVNATRNVNFVLPSSPNEVITRP